VSVCRVFGSNRVYRGGSWGSVPQGARVANRNNFTPDNRNYFLGVRLVRRCSCSSAAC